ncbi:MAG: helix-turn-helix domain-containing protein [Sutterella sp.]|nr:helix-turn-helix domain-containing protein [Sutterella sp.]
MAQETSDMNEPVLHPAPAEGFGAALKRAREAQGISIGDMAARSRLSVQQVRALESERTAELPEPVYVRAFIRGVASVLGLEPDPLVADYTARYGAASVGVLPDHDPAKETVVRASGRRTGLKAAVVAIAAVLVCAAGWYAWSSMSDGAETQPAAETPVVDAPESVEAAPAPEQAAADQTAQEKTAAEQAAAEKAAAEKAAAEKAAAEKAAAEKAAAEKAAAEKAAAEKAAAEKARAQSQAAATGERRVTLSTSGACWVQILLPNGRSFFAKEMAEGGSETLNVPVGARVTVGNASVMTLTVDGRPYELTKSTRNGICRFVVK